MTPEIVQDARAHIAHLSIRDQISGARKRLEFKPNVAFAQQQGIGLVEFVPGIKMPAAIGIRTTVLQQKEVDGRLVDKWNLTLAPFTGALLRRLYAAHNPRSAQAQTTSGIYDAPVPMSLEVSYDAVDALKVAHQALSDLLPPRVGTSVEMTYAITHSLSRVVAFHASSTELARKGAQEANRHNARETAKWKAAHWPANGPLNIFGIRLYPWWGVEEVNLWPVPEVVMGRDPWEPDGSVYTLVGDVVAKHFAPVMESLWKAVFAQDGEDCGEGKVAHSLRRQGYELDSLESTRMGYGPLRELMGQHRSSRDVTMLGSAEVAQELGDEFVRNLTHIGN